MSVLGSEGNLTSATRAIDHQRFRQVEVLGGLLRTKAWTQTSQAISARLRRETGKKGERDYVEGFNMLMNAV